jgi:hypothetical protein
MPVGRGGRLESEFDESYLSLTINFFAMTNRMNHDSPFVVKDLVDDAIIADAEFMKPRELARQWFSPDLVEIRSEPIEALSDAATNGFV